MSYDGDLILLLLDDDLFWKEEPENVGGMESQSNGAAGRRLRS